MTGLLIYGLMDPRDGDCRYVGLSMRGMKRPQEHLRAVKVRDQTHRANWLRSLKSTGLNPTITVLEECSTLESLSESESYWITLLRIAGCDLTNHMTGGLNGRSRPDQATKDKIRAAQIGRQFSDEHRQRISAAKVGTGIGRKHTAATRLKMSAAQSGENNPRFGIPIPGGEQYRFKPGHVPKTLANTVGGQAGEKHPMYGKRHTAESKALMSKSKLGQVPWNKGLGGS